VSERTSAFTEKEKNRRLGALGRLVRAGDLQALLLVGDMGVGEGFYGGFRYCTNNHVFFQRQIVVLLPGSEPVLFSYSEFSRQASTERSFIVDCRSSTDFMADVVTLLHERGAAGGRIGVNLDVLPSTWYRYLDRELPGIEVVDVTKDILEIRFQHSAEELEGYRESAAIGDAAFDAVLKMLRPGVSENEIAAEIEYIARKKGAEESFTLISSGKFSSECVRSLSLPVPPSGRRVRTGDSVVMEITPCYQGYWTQLVRIVNIGQQNEDLERIQGACRDATARGAGELRPGRRVKDVARAMHDHAVQVGFAPMPHFGHLCGLDLLEEEVNLANE